jgi:hypothetical protein
MGCEFHILVPKTALTSFFRDSQNGQSALWFQLLSNNTNLCSDFFQVTYYCWVSVPILSNVFIRHIFGDQFVIVKLFALFSYVIEKGTVDFVFKQVKNIIYLENGKWIKRREKTAKCHTNVYLNRNNHESLINALVEFSCNYQVASYEERPP